MSWKTIALVVVVTWVVSMMGAMGGIYIWRNLDSEGKENKLPLLSDSEPKSTNQSTAAQASKNSRPSENNNSVDTKIVFKLIDPDYKALHKKIYFNAKVKNLSDANIRGIVCTRFFDSTGREIIKSVSDSLDLSAYAEQVVVGDGTLIDRDASEIVSAKMYVGKYGCVDKPDEAISAVVETRLEFKSALAGGASGYHSSRQASADPLDEGLCMGAASMAIKMGNKPSDFSQTAIEQVKILTDKYRSVDIQWSSTADRCFVPGLPMQQIVDCMESNITDKIAFQFFKGVVLSRNRVASKSWGEAQFIANSFCASLVK